MTNFAKWLETFVAEKRLDREQILSVEGPSGTNYIPLGIVVDAIIGAPESEQRVIKGVIVKIDFLNGDVVDYFRHLAQAIAI